MKALTSRPFAINLFAKLPPPPKVDEAPMLAALAPLHRELGIPAPAIASGWPDFDEQLEAVLEARPAVFSFTLGAPTSQALERFRRAGIRHRDRHPSRRSQAAGRARSRRDRGAGLEAGGHRGTFVGEAEMR